MKIRYEPIIYNEKFHEFYTYRSLFDESSEKRTYSLYVDYVLTEDFYAFQNDYEWI